MTEPGDGNSKPQSQSNLCQPSRTTVQGRATQHRAASTSAQSIQMQAGGAWGRVPDRNKAEGRGSGQMKADREESGVKVPRSDSGTVRLMCKQHVAAADSMTARQTLPLHTELWPLPFAVPTQTTFFTALCQGCMGKIMGPFSYAATKQAACGTLVLLRSFPDAASLLTPTSLCIIGWRVHLGGTRNTLRHRVSWVLESRVKQYLDFCAVVLLTKPIV